MSDTTRTLIAKRTWRYGLAAVVGLVCMTVALQAVRGQDVHQKPAALHQAAPVKTQSAAHDALAATGQEAAPAKLEPAAAIDPDLERVLAQTAAGEPVSVLVFLSEQVDLDPITAGMDARRATLRERHQTVVRALQQTAAATQGGLLAHLNALQQAGRIEGFRPFWVANCIRVDAEKALIAQLATRPDVGMIYFNYLIETIEPIAGPAEGPDGIRGGGPEPGLIAVRAPEVWDMGYTGEGILVATLDTGVDGNHPALASRWRGVADPRYQDHPEWAWFDPVTNTTFPQAFGSHGTHTMGTVCGGSPGDQIGVAPGAQWIHAAIIDRVSIPQTVADAILSFQWMIDPDENPETNWDVPAVCSNSWGLTTWHGYAPCDDIFWSYLDACEAAGIVILFSAGNEGPGANTLRRPADRATDEYRTSAVGAVDAQDPDPPWPIAGFSSRGPSYCTPGGDAAIKPELAAPGVNVRSSVPGGGYQGYGWSGTSMASPHVNGAVALIRQACPDLTVQQVLQILYDTAHDQGPDGNDNDYGFGMLDAYEAVQLALSMCSGQTVLPHSFMVTFGTLQSGELPDLFYSDDARVVIQAGPRISLLHPSVQVEVQGTAGLATPSELRFTLEASCDAIPPNATQVIELYNFHADDWEIVDERIATPTDSVVEVIISSNPSRFITPDATQTHARLSWFEPPHLLIVSWRASIDQTVWTVVP